MTKKSKCEYENNLLEKKQKYCVTSQLLDAHTIYKTKQDLLAILFEIEPQIYIPLKQNKRWIARKYVTHFSFTSMTYF